MSRRTRVIEILGNKCFKCKIEHDNKSFFDVDHIVPIKDGRGRRHYHVSRIEEYMVLCPNCHREKTLAEDGFVSRK